MSIKIEMMKSDKSNYESFFIYDSNSLSLSSYHVYETMILIVTVGPGRVGGDARWWARSPLAGEQGLVYRLQVIVE